MTDTPVPKGSEFDGLAGEYDDMLDRGISVSGESKEYFLHGRVAWTKRRVRQRGLPPRSVMDFGCGTGSAARVLLDVLSARTVEGVDTSVRSLELARLRHAAAGLKFSLTAERPPAADIDLCYCNGVFHHIAPSARLHTVAYVFDSLKTGGLFALWENNPWNPGARIVMRRIPFDREALPLSMPQARRLMVAGGFQIVCTDFLFVFPRPFSFLRFLEPSLSHVPFGAQYMILGRKPDGLRKREN